jgi:DNA polymerase III subunit delta'
MSLEPYQTIQPKVIKMLYNSYQKKRLAHAYLFEGEKGTKKKEIAFLFAKLLYCENDDKPCGVCINCQRIDHSNHPNVLYIEPEAKTLKKEQIIMLQREYEKTALEVGPKVYIVNEIEKMSENASNSLLKFIEEPEPDTYTILITEQIQSILDTIISRTQVLSFQPIPKQERINYLVSQEIDVKLASIVSELTNDLDCALELAKDEKIIEIMDLVINLGRSLLSKHENPIIIVENSKADIYNKKEELEYFLDILLIYQQDVQKVMLNNPNLVFKDELDFIKTHVSPHLSQTILKNINCLLQSKINLTHHANSLMLIDSLLIKLGKEG